MEPRVAVSFNRSRDATAPNEPQAMPWLNGPPVMAYEAPDTLFMYELVSLTTLGWVGSVVVCNAAF